jgi:LmbE family N-acetylglucosaminyl deacetylase
MFYDDPRSLAADYAHVYLAPHLDDAPLSCGGAIAGQVARGERVLVVTLCTAAPPPGTALSALAESFHRDWGLSAAAAMATRLGEERAALAALGADGLAAGMLDAIYRHPAAYSTRGTLFGAPAPDDPLLPALRGFLADLRERLPGAVFYAPLGVGSHVDHLVTHRAALELLGPALRCYEDFPYVARAGALERRVAELGRRFEAESVAIGAGLERKIAAIWAYSSQLPELAHSQLERPVADGEAAALFAAVVADYARAAGAGVPVERYWRAVG